MFFKILLFFMFSMYNVFNNKRRLDIFFLTNCQLEKRWRKWTADMHSKNTCMWFEIFLSGKMGHFLLFFRSACWTIWYGSCCWVFSILWWGLYMFVCLLVFVLFFCHAMSESSRLMIWILPSFFRLSFPYINIDLILNLLTCTAFAFIKIEHSKKKNAGRIKCGLVFVVSEIIF